MNTADPSDVGRMGKKEKELNDVSVNDARWVMSDIRGRRFLWQLMGKCNVFRAEYCSSGSELYYRDGSRRVGTDMLKLLEVSDFEKCNLMRKEAHNDEYAES